MVYAKQGLRRIVYQCMMMILAFDTLFFVSGAQANSENVTARDILQRALETVKNRPPMMADGEVHSKYHSRDKETKIVSRVYTRNQQNDTTRVMWELKHDKWVKLHEHRGIWDGSRYTVRDREEPYETESGYFFRGDFFVIYDDKPRTVGWATQLYSLWGTTWRGKHFAEEMLESETFLRTEMEQIDGFDCYVVEGDTPKGHKTVWIDPKHGYLHRKMICKGDPNNPDNLRGIEIIDTKIEYLEGIPVVTEAERHFFPKFIDVNRLGATKATLTQHEKMSNVVWNPDFEAMGAFKMDKVPNGTPVIYRANDLDKTGVKFHWQGGKIVLNVDKKATALPLAKLLNISGELSQARKRSAEEFQEARQKAFDWAVANANLEPARDFAYGVAVKIDTNDSPKQRKKWLEKFSRAFPDDPRSRPISSFEPAVNINQPLTLKFEDIKGRKIDTAAFKGKVVVVDFWTTWCDPCRRAEKVLEKLYTEYSVPKRLEIIGISGDAEKQKVTKFLAKTNYPWPIVWDNQGKFATHWEVTAIPYFLIIDQKGILRFKGNTDQVRTEILKYLGEK